LGEERNYSIETVEAISPKNTGIIAEIISSLKIDTVLWSLTPSSIVYQSFFKKLGVPLWGLFNYPVYHLTELMPALKQVPFRYLKQYFRNWMIPYSLIAQFLNSNSIKGIFCQSRRNINRLSELGVRVQQLHHLPPGFDLEEWKTSLERAQYKHFTFVYTGSISAIRGINCLVDAFCCAAREEEGIRLLVLARGAVAQEVERLKEKCKKKGIGEEIEIIGGWLEPEVLKKLIEGSQAVVLPFLLVPSEMPLSFLEAMGMGKPVIGTDLDGIPEMVEERGIVVKAGNVKRLTEAMLLISRDENIYKKMQRNCILQMKRYPSWEQSVNKLETILNG